ncbi:STAS domain-containing protein, partial [Lentzea sp. NPDC006480]|uniref:STAS domain-containing protein n=1 Tax=Lentzea sp. NPDC006480 TaxID=3157176 RepID=UPI0033BEADF0
QAGSPQLAQTKVSVENGVVVVTLTGEVDMVNADEVRSTLQAQLDELPRALVVDLALEFLGSAGLIHPVPESTPKPSACAIRNAEKPTSCSRPRSTAA